MTAAELIEELSKYPGDLRVMLYDFEAHDQWLDINVKATEVKPPVNGVAKYGTGQTIISIEIG